MPIVGRINKRCRVGMRRGQPSRKISLEGEVTSFRELGTRVDVLSISKSGLLLKTDAPMSLRENIKILFLEGRSRVASVVWANDTLFACQFDRLLTPKMINEVGFQNKDRLSFGTQDEQLFLGDPDDRETMGRRLRRIRLCRGLSLVVLAERIGVSKPTLLKWEKDKSFPRQEMIWALSEALDAPEAELIYGTRPGTRKPEPAAHNSSPVAEELIGHSKQMIARVTSVATSRMRVEIEK